VAFLTPAELLRIAGLRPELRALVLPLMQATEDATGKKLTIPPNGGLRSNLTQQALYAARGSNPYPVAIPGRSRHEYGAAVDLNIIGGNDDDYAQLASIAEGMFALHAAGPSDRVHIQLNESLEDSIARWDALQSERVTTASSWVLVALAVLLFLPSAKRRTTY
jgi:hypothetical protein